MLAYNEAKDALLLGASEIKKLRDENERLRIGNARYEYVRTLAPYFYAQLWERALRGEGKFDDLVDEGRRAREM